jgi:hypothetical protein
MPEPIRSWARQAIEEARVRAEARIADRDSREAS